MHSSCVGVVEEQCLSPRIHDLDIEPYRYPAWWTRESLLENDRELHYSSRSFGTILYSYVLVVFGWPTASSNAFDIGVDLVRRLFGRDPDPPHQQVSSSKSGLWIIGLAFTALGLTAYPKTLLASLNQFITSYAPPDLRILLLLYLVSSLLGFTAGIITSTLQASSTNRSAIRALLSWLWILFTLLVFILGCWQIHTNRLDGRDVLPDAAILVTSHHPNQHLYRQCESIAHHGYAFCIPLPF